MRLGDVAHVDDREIEARGHRHAAVHQPRDQRRRSARIVVEQRPEDVVGIDHGEVVVAAGARP